MKKTDRPRRPSTAPRAILRSALDGGLEWVLNEGFVWVHTTFLPALEQFAAPDTSADKKLAARATFLCGELWQLVDAPLAALDACERCVALAPDEAAAWSELAHVRQRVGQKAAAREALRRAITLAPAHVDELETSLYWDDVRFRKNDAAWMAAEALARGDAEEALKRLSAARPNVKVRRWRACAHGVRNDVDAVIAEWVGIVTSTRGPVLIEYADWFYLPPDAWGHAMFWETLHALGDRLDEEGIFPSDASLDRARGFSDAQRALLTFARRGAEADANMEALRAMLKWRPRWQEVKESMARLSEA